MAPVVWYISYRHSLRLDEAGVKLIPDQTETAGEKLRLEARGYIVSRIANKPTPASILGFT
jgi:hypothetical protein